MRAVLTAFSLVALLPWGARGDSPVEFNRDIRPILSDNCYSCHGPDQSKRLSGLRLDTPEGARADLGGRHGVLPGDPQASGVFQRVSASDPARRMPPTYSKKTLSDDQVELLRRWIEQGGDYQRHWAFLAPRKAEPPTGAEPNWPRNAIDNFVRARLEAQGLEPSPEASRETLIRRVSFDLTGLPPTLEEIDDFLADQAPGAYERVVDRLLESPRYGERMAIRWLDASRYADTNGYQTDAARIQWRWRDWVIDAFNSNKPFDRFTVEQLAGDLLPNATVDQIVATGFNRNHRGNSEGGIVPEEYLVEYVVDRVETTSTVWMGLTVGCARCHDHKFDPITQREFYKIYAYFNNIPERGRIFKYGNTPPMVAAPTHRQRNELAELDAALATAEQRLERAEPKIETAQRRWEQWVADDGRVDWRPSNGLLRRLSFDDADLGFSAGDPERVDGVAGQAGAFDGQRYVDLGDTGSFGYQSRFTLTAWIRPNAPNGAIIARTTRGDSDGQDRGFGGYGLYLIDGKLQFNLIQRWLDDGIRVETKATVPLKEWRHVAMTYDGSRFAGGVEFFIDGEPVEKTILLDLMNQQTGVKQPLLVGAGGGLERAFEGAIDEVAIYERDLSAREIEILAERRSLNGIAALPAGERSAAQRSMLRRAFLERYARSSLQAAWRDRNALVQQRREFTAALPTVMVMHERDEIAPTHILNRGAYDQPGERVTRGTPEVLPPLPEDAPNSRLGFAQWLVDPSHPLTARVAVNRFWQSFFGSGLVRTVEDFGSQGEWPTHPALLDWLAVDFIESDWNVKAIVKKIVMSSTYRQSSRATSGLIEKDPDNRLLARGPRMRLPAEMLRDQALAASGLLVEQLGGPSVKPYQPDGLWKELSGGRYEQDHGDKLYRRSLYAFWKRTAPPPWMMNFDSAGREACQVRETRTNTPLQALNLMNDVAYVEAARALAQRMMREGGLEPSQRLAYGFRVATARLPKMHEATVLASSLNYYLERYRNQPREAEEFLSAGESPRDLALEPTEHAAYAAVAGLILNLDETLTKE